MSSSTDRDTNTNTENGEELPKNYTNFTLPRRAGTFTEKFKRMWLEQPFIPLGAGATCFFLLSGLRGEQHSKQDYYSFMKMTASLVITTAEQ